MKTATDVLTIFVFIVVVSIAVIVLSPIILIVAVYSWSWERRIKSCLAKGPTFAECEKCPEANARACDEIARERDIREMTRRGEMIPSYMFE